MPNTAFAQSLNQKSGGKIPAETATPEDIRMYITELLIDDYFTPPDEAKKHAAKWEIGRCSQLFLNDQEAQRRIFGENVGLCLHTSLQKRMKTLWEEEPTVAYSKYAYMGSGALLAVVSAFLLSTLDFTQVSDIRTFGQSSLLWILNGACGVYYLVKHPYDPNKAAVLGLLTFITFIIGFLMFMAYFIASRT